MTKNNKDEAAMVKKQGDSKMELAQDLPAFVPATDIYEKEDEVLVVCDIPGVSPERVSIEMERNVLTVTAQQDDQAPENADLVYRDYRTGIFRRSFTVTTPVEADKIRASLKQGVLHLSLPKAESAQPRKITVEAE
jgi:HSP20 family protein